MVFAVSATSRADHIKTDPATRATPRVDHHTKKMKVLMNKETSCKDAVAPKKATPQKLLVGKGAADGGIRLSQAVRKKDDESLAAKRDATPERAQAKIAQYKETPDFKFGLEKIDRVSYEYGHKVALARFRGKYPQLEIEEDPYATLPEMMTCRWRQRFPSMIVIPHRHRGFCI
ncbi:hypothetical protein B296_00039430 [Ensete ventricosum]|uniref:Uncharacterized protein n=1 Tax=Ensete ventricosum TaxID=4639 RepID=A0A426ZQK7_ENSVE|nr:hypothetical protein B296_00039430 [Ensete ventricosum]